VGEKTNGGLGYEGGAFPVRERRILSNRGVFAERNQTDRGSGNQGREKAALAQARYDADERGQGKRKKRKKRGKQVPKAAALEYLGKLGLVVGGGGEKTTGRGRWHHETLGKKNEVARGGTFRGLGLGVLWTCRIYDQLAGPESLT